MAKTSKGRSEQSKLFIEMAKMVEASDTEDAFSAKIRKIAQSTGKSRVVEKRKKVAKAKKAK